MRGRHNGRCVTVPDDESAAVTTADNDCQQPVRSNFSAAGFDHPGAPLRAGIPPSVARPNADAAESVRHHMDGPGGDRSGRPKRARVGVEGAAVRFAPRRNLPAGAVA